MHVWISNCLLDTHKQQIVYYKVVYGKIVWKLCHIDSGLADFFVTSKKTELAKKSEIFCVSLESVLEIRRWLSSSWSKTSIFSTSEPWRQILQSGRELSLSVLDNFCFVVASKATAAEAGGKKMWT